VIVLDASAVVEPVVEPESMTGTLRTRLRADPDIHVPHLVDAEVTGARIARAGGHRVRVELV
jgi:hypothetical protein